MENCCLFGCAKLDADRVQVPLRIQITITFNRFPLRSDAAVRS